MSIKQFYIALTAVAALAGCKTETLGTSTVREGGNSVEATGVTAREKLRAFRIHVGISGEGKAAEVSASRVESALDDEFAANGFSVIGKGDVADIVVRGKVGISDKTQRGDRIVVRGTTSVSMYRKSGSSMIAGKAANGGLISAKSFEGVSPESFSAEEALQKLGSAFDGDVRKWARETSEKVSKGICVCELEITGLRSPHTVKDGYPTWFAARVLKMPGVHDCRVFSDEREPTKMSAVVVYERSQFPDGVLSRLRAFMIFKDKDGN